MSHLTMRSVLAMALLAGTVFLSVGCGGGGGNTSASSSATTGRAAVYLTDSPREEFAHVWTTIYHVELVPQDGSANVVAFDDPSGRQIDLKTLRDASGERYTFLSSTTVPAGSYTGAIVTIGSTLQLIKAGATTGDTLTVDSSIPIDTNGHAVVTAAFKKPKTLGSTTNNVIVDFNLAKFVINGTKILPILAEGSGDGLRDAARHDKDDYHGTVSGLSGTAPVFSFTLTRRKGDTVMVTTTAATALFGDTTLADGAIVDVTGTLDPSTQAITATQVTTRSSADTPKDEAAGTCKPQVTGTASNLDATTGTLTLTVERAHGLTVIQTTVTVVVGADTKLRGDTGATIMVADLFATLATTPTLSVEGTYDAASNTLTATRVRVVDTTQDGGWASAAHQPRGYKKGESSKATVSATDWSNGTLP